MQNTITPQAGSQTISPQKTPKVYVTVNVEFTKEGQMRPRSLVWEDGMTYKIDRVKNISPAYAARAGGQGDRYEIVVNGLEKYIFFEHSVESGKKVIGKWFVERK